MATENTPKENPCSLFSSGDFCCLLIHVEEFEALFFCKSGIIIDLLQSQLALLGLTCVKNLKTHFYFLYFQEFLPDLYQHFQTQSFHTSMYASSWFLTLFATVVPMSVACRVMDVFISEVGTSDFLCLKFGAKYSLNVSCRIFFSNLGERVRDFCFGNSVNF